MFSLMELRLLFIVEILVLFKMRLSKNFYERFFKRFFVEFEALAYSSQPIVSGVFLNVSIHSTKHFQTHAKILVIKLYSSKLSILTEAEIIRRRRAENEAERSASSNKPANVCALR